ncbi:MAG: alkaline phosphatase family protein [Armatimonadota bacterium]|jgi:predicted AlkP superfamily phosphohydrolase/phosphomutase
MTGHPSVILIGLDGGAFDLIDPWLDAGELPAIASLLCGGARARLRSTHPPLTPVAWSSMLTGCNPGKHGAFAFMRIGGDYAPEFLNGGAISIPTIFELLTGHGVRVGALNIPWTWPPPALDGFCLSGLDAPAFGPEIAHPAGLFEEIAAQFAGYFDKTVPADRNAYALDRLERKIAKTGAMARYLARTRPVDLLALCFVSTDHVQHHFFRTRSVTTLAGRRVDDLLLHTWRLVDREVGRVVESLAGPATTVMLVSDHGAGPTEGGINLGRWLAERGWLCSRPPDLARSVRGRALRAGSRLLPGAIREALRGRLVGTRRRLISRLLAEGVDWAHTDAFCWSDYGSISLNLDGRFDAGRVPESRRCELVDEIVAGLADLRDPETGERVMSAALRAEEIYHGPRVAEAPDLLAVPRGYRREILTDFTLSGPLTRDRADDVFAPAVREGTHRLHGMLGLSGRSARSGFEAIGARIEDIAPTLLHLLGQPVPAYMDGRVLSEMLRGMPSPAREQTGLPDRACGGGYTTAEAAAVERDLRGLGYL